MKTTITVNPKYESLRAFLERIPTVFEHEGREIYHLRNVIKVLACPDGTSINVKRFHQPRGINRFVYSWQLRTPKGERSYDYAFRLNGEGISSPEAVALIEERGNMNLLGFSYLITLQSPLPHTLYEIKNAKEEEYAPLARALALFAARMHKAGILHKDFTPGNILWERGATGYHFTVVDINRMRFGDISMKEGLNNLKKFWGPKHFTEILAEEYAKARHADAEKAVAYILNRRKSFWQRYLKKHEVPFTVEL